VLAHCQLSGFASFFALAADSIISGVAAREATLTSSGHHTARSACTNTCTGTSNAAATNATAAAADLGPFIYKLQLGMGPQRRRLGSALSCTGHSLLRSCIRHRVHRAGEATNAGASLALGATAACAHVHARSAPASLLECWLRTGCLRKAYIRSLHRCSRIRFSR
jgi:hypothetical protein